MDKYASFHTVFCCLRAKNFPLRGNRNGKAESVKTEGRETRPAASGQRAVLMRGLQSKDRRAGRGRVMGHEHGRPVPRFLLQQFLHAAARLVVQGVERLVQQQKGS